MSAESKQCLFFLGLPGLKSLCCVTMSLQDEEEPRSKQIKTCRELLLLHLHILASPALDSFTDITVVMAIQFYQGGFLQAFGQRRGLQLGSPQCVFPGVLQCCLSFSLITRLAPSWNKAGLFLIKGKDFLSESGRLGAVSLEFNTTEGQSCVSIEASTVRLPLVTLQDFGLSPLVLRRFATDPGSILDHSSIGGAIWCHVLPSMKKGQIVDIRRQPPKDGPFKTYRALQSHWNRLYGYLLPHLAEEEVVYCSVYFKLVGEQLFTYPLSCIRLQPVQRCPRADLQGTLCSFLVDLRGKLRSVCGFPARLTEKPCYPAVSLNTAASLQVLSPGQVNLSRPVHIQLPPLPPPEPYPGSQPPAGTPHSHQAATQGLPGKSSERNQGGLGGDEGWPLISSRVSASTPPLSFSTQFLTSFPPASPLPTSSDLPPLLPPSETPSHPGFCPPTQTPVRPAPRLVPIFKNKQPSRHVNVAQLRAQKLQQHANVEGDKRGRLSLMIKTPASSPSISCLSLLPPPTVPRFKPRFGSSNPQPQPCCSKLQHITSLSPPSKPKAVLPQASKPGEMLTPKTRQRTAVSTNKSSACKPIWNLKGTESQRASAADPPPPASSETKYRKRAVVFESKAKAHRAEEVNVEKMARSSQLSKVKAATLLAWLKERGVHVSGKHRKEELMLKVMSRLSET